MKKVWIWSPVANAVPESATAPVTIVNALEFAVGEETVNWPVVAEVIELSVPVWSVVHAGIPPVKPSTWPFDPIPSFTNDVVEFAYSKSPVV